MATKWFTNNWRMPRNANQNKLINFSKAPGGFYRVSGNPLYNLSNFTYSFWLNRSSSSGIQGILSRWSNSGGGSNEYIFRFNNNAIQVYTPSSDIPVLASYFSTTAPNAPLYDKWIHYAFVKQGAKIDYYIDGYLATTQTNNVPSGPIGTSTAQTWIGQYGNYSLEGSFAEPIFYSAALSAGSNISIGDAIDPNSDIGKLHNAKSPFSLSKKPLAYYNIDSQTMSGTSTQLPNSAIGNFVIDTPGTANSNIVLPTQSSLGLSTASKMSLSIWYFLDSSTASTTQGLFGYNYGNANGNGLYARRSSDKINIVIGNNNLTSNFRQLQVTDSATNQWHHLVVVFDGTQTDADPATQDAKRIKMYLDGQETGALVTGSAGTIPSVLPNGGASGTGNRNFRIGGIEGATGVVTNHWMGKLSNAQIWTSSLTSEDVTTLYNSGSPLTLMPNNDLSTTAIAWYKMDGTSSFSDPTTTWTFPNAVYNQLTPNYTTALRFNGIDDFIYASGSDISGNKTVSIWFYANDITLSDTLFEIQPIPNNNDYLRIWIFNSKILAASGPGNSNGKSSSTLLSNTWYHLVVTKTTGSVTNIYINGVDDTQTANGTLGFTAGDNGDTIIGRSATAGKFFKGDLSNISIFNTALNLSQVTTLFNAGTPEQDISFSPVNWWKLTSGSASGTIIDTQGNNNGTNSNPGAETVNTNVVVAEDTLPATSVGYPANSLIVDSLITETGYSNSSFLWPQASSDKMTCGPSPITASSSNFTISVWIKKSDQLPTDHDVILCTGLTTTGSKLQVAMTCKDDDLYLFYNSDQALTGDYIVAKNALPEISPDPWWHCVFVKDTLPGSGKLYVNGAEAYLDPASSADFSVNPLVSNTDLTIGDWDATSKPFYGNISNISIHGVSFTQGEVTELYNNGIPKNLAQGPQQAALKHWWPLDAANSMWDEGTTTWYSRNVKDAAQEGAMPNSDVSYMSGDAPNSFLNAFHANMSIESFQGESPISINNAYSINVGYGDKQTL